MSQKVMNSSLFPSTEEKLVMRGSEGPESSSYLARLSGSPGMTVTSRSTASIHSTLSNGVSNGDHTRRSRSSNTSRDTVLPERCSRERFFEYYHVNNSTTRPSASPSTIFYPSESKHFNLVDGKGATSSSTAPNNSGSNSSPTCRIADTASNGPYDSSKEIAERATITAVSAEGGKGVCYHDSSFFTSPESFWRDHVSASALTPTQGGEWNSPYATCVPSIPDKVWKAELPHWNRVHINRISTNPQNNNNADHQHHHPDLPKNSVGGYCEVESHPYAPPRKATFSTSYSKRVDVDEQDKRQNNSLSAFAGQNHPLCGTSPSPTTSKLSSKNGVRRTLTEENKEETLGNAEGQKQKNEEENEREVLEHGHHPLRRVEDLTPAKQDQRSERDASTNNNDEEEREEILTPPPPPQRPLLPVENPANEEGTRLLFSASSSSSSSSAVSPLQQQQRWHPPSPLPLPPTEPSILPSATINERWCDGGINSNNNPQSNGARNNNNVSSDNDRDDGRERQGTSPSLRVVGGVPSSSSSPSASSRSSPFFFSFSSSASAAPASPGGSSTTSRARKNSSSFPIPVCGNKKEAVSLPLSLVAAPVAIVAPVGRSGSRDGGSGEEGRGCQSGDSRGNNFHQSHQLPSSGPSSANGFVGTPSPTPTSTTSRSQITAEIFHSATRSPSLNTVMRPPTTTATATGGRRLRTAEGVMSNTAPSSSTPSSFFPSLSPSPSSSSSPKETLRETPWTSSEEASPGTSRTPQEAWRRALPPPPLASSSSSVSQHVRIFSPLQRTDNVVEKGRMNNDDEKKEMKKKYGEQISKVRKIDDKGTEVFDSCSTEANRTRRTTSSSYSSSCTSVDSISSSFSDDEDKLVPATANHLSQSNFPSAHIPTCSPSSSSSVGIFLHGASPLSDPHVLPQCTLILRQRERIHNLLCENWEQQVAYQKLKHLFEGLASAYQELVQNMHIKGIREGEQIDEGGGGEEKRTTQDSQPMEEKGLVVYLQQQDEHIRKLEIALQHAQEEGEKRLESQQEEWKKEQAHILEEHYRELAMAIRDLSETTNKSAAGEKEEVEEKYAARGMQRETVFGEGQTTIEVPEHRRGGGGGQNDNENLSSPFTDGTAELLPLMVSPEAPQQQKQQPPPRHSLFLPVEGGTKEPCSVGWSQDEGARITMKEAEEEQKKKIQRHEGVDQRAKLFLDPPPPSFPHRVISSCLSSFTPRGVEERGREGRGAGGDGEEKDEDECGREGRGMTPPPGHDDEEKEKEERKEPLAFSFSFSPKPERRQERHREEEMLRRGHMEKREALLEVLSSELEDLWKQHLMVLQDRTGLRRQVEQLEKELAQQSEHFQQEILPSALQQVERKAKEMLQEVNAVQSRREEDLRAAQEELEVRKWKGEEGMERATRAAEQAEFRFHSLQEVLREKENLISTLRQELLVSLQSNHRQVSMGCRQEVEEIKEKGRQLQQLEEAVLRAEKDREVEERNGWERLQQYQRQERQRRAEETFALEDLTRRVHAAEEVGRQAKRQVQDHLDRLHVLEEEKRVLELECRRVRREKEEQEERHRACEEKRQRLMEERDGLAKEREGLLRHVKQLKWRCERQDKCLEEYQHALLESKSENQKQRLLWFSSFPALTARSRSPSSSSSREGKIHSSIEPSFAESEEAVKWEYDAEKEKKRGCATNNTASNNNRRKKRVGERELEEREGGKKKKEGKEKCCTCARHHQQSRCSVEKVRRDEVEKRSPSSSSNPPLHNIASSTSPPLPPTEYPTSVAIDATTIVGGEEEMESQPLHRSSSTSSSTSTSSDHHYYSPSGLVRSPSSSTSPPPVVPSCFVKRKAKGNKTVQRKYLKESPAQIPPPPLAPPLLSTSPSHTPQTSSSSTRVDAAFCCSEHGGNKGGGGGWGDLHPYAIKKEKVVLVSSFSSSRSEEHGRSACPVKEGELVMWKAKREKKEESKSKRGEDKDEQKIKEKVQHEMGCSTTEERLGGRKERGGNPITPRPQPALQHPQYESFPTTSHGCSSFSPTPTSFPSSSLSPPPPSSSSSFLYGENFQKKGPQDPFHRGFPFYPTSFPISFAAVSKVGGCRAAAAATEAVKPEPSWIHVYDMPRREEVLSPSYSDQRIIDVTFAAAPSPLPSHRHHLSTATAITARSRCSSREDEDHPPPPHNNINNNGHGVKGRASLDPNENASSSPCAPPPAPPTPPQGNIMFGGRLLEEEEVKDGSWRDKKGEKRIEGMLGVSPVGSEEEKEWIIQKTMEKTQEEEKDVKGREQSQVNQKCRKELKERSDSTPASSLNFTLHSLSPFRFSTSFPDYKKATNHFHISTPASTIPSTCSTSRSIGRRKEEENNHSTPVPTTIRNSADANPNDWMTAGGHGGGEEFHPAVEVDALEYFQCLATPSRYHPHSHEPDSVPREGCHTPTAPSSRMMSYTPCCTSTSRAAEVAASAAQAAALATASEISSTLSLLKHHHSQTSPSSSSSSSQRLWKSLDAVIERQQKRQQQHHPSYSSRSSNTSPSKDGPFAYSSSITKVSCEETASTISNAPFAEEKETREAEEEQHRGAQRSWVTSPLHPPAAKDRKEQRKGGSRGEWKIVADPENSSSSSFTSLTVDSGILEGTVTIGQAVEGGGEKEKAKRLLPRKSPSLERLAALEEAFLTPFQSKTEQWV